MLRPDLGLFWGALARLNCVNRVGHENNGCVGCDECES